MEKNSIQSEIVNHNTIKSEEFMSIGQLLSESWLTFKKSILNLFLISLLSFVLSLISIGIIGLVVIISIGVKISSLSSFNFSNLLTSNFSTLLVPFIALVLGFLLFVIIQAALQIASIIVIDKKGEEGSFGKALGIGFSLAIPLIATLILTQIIILGGLFLFIIPVLIFGLMLMFVPYEVALSGKSLFKAINGSLKITIQHFGEILVRWLVMVGIVLGIMIFLPLLLEAVNKNLGLMFRFIMIFGNMLVSWYFMAYSVTLYKDAKEKTDWTKKTNTIWVWLIAIFGWIMAVTLGILLYNTIQSKIPDIEKLIQNKEKIENLEQKEAERITSYIPSACGLSVPVTNTSDTYEGKDRKWIFKEYPLKPEAFITLDQNVLPHEVAWGSFLFYKSQDDESGINPGFEIICVDNTKSLTQEDYLALALANKDYEVSHEDSLKWGEVPLDLVYVKGTNSEGEEFRDVQYVGLSKDEKKLFLIKWWGVDEEKFATISAQLDEDMLMMRKNLKYRDVNETISDLTTQFLNSNKSNNQQSTNTNSQVSSCTPFNIREGEFASNKCYSQQDYDDLQYYLQRFNSSAATYNGAVASMSITCNGSDFFKDQCEQDKKDKEQAEADINNYRNTINGIIAKGR
ncbi:hypothetical protein GYA49_02035 [Candidatus Beckwithbacteria bacterium]|nr:hypothetical protein [Candidatus Beckwithbacteria bacterium]